MILKFECSFVSYLILILFSTNIFAEKIVYINPFFSENSLIIDSVNNTAILDNHLIHKVSFCKKTSKLYCINSKLLSFSIPKKFRKLVKTVWVHNGFKYKLERIEKTHYFGRQFEVAIVHSKQMNEDILFSFSSKFGLLTMTMISSHSTGFLLLSSKCGLGSTIKKC